MLKLFPQRPASVFYEIYVTFNIIFGTWPDIWLNIQKCLIGNWPHGVYNPFYVLTTDLYLLNQGGDWFLNIWWLLKLIFLFNNHLFISCHSVLTNEVMAELNMQGNRGEQGLAKSTSSMWWKVQYLHILINCMKYHTKQDSLIIKT